MTSDSQLSGRERQLLDIVYKLDKASAKEVQEELSDGSSDSTVRTLLRSLVEKGKIKYREEGLKYVYFPSIARSKASKNALRRLVDTFFEQSPAMAANTLLEMSRGKTSKEELEQLEALIAEEKKKLDK